MKTRQGLSCYSMTFVCRLVMTWHRSTISKNSNIPKIAILNNKIQKYYLKLLKVVLNRKNDVFSVVVSLKAVQITVLIVVTLL
jgi:hypothetical protein